MGRYLVEEKESKDVEVYTIDSVSKSKMLKWKFKQRKIEQAQERQNRKASKKLKRKQEKQDKLENERKNIRKPFKKKLRRRDQLHVKDFRKNDPFPGDAPVSEAKIKRYERGEKMEEFGARTKFATGKFQAQEKKLQLASKQAARSELLLQEEAGYLEADEGEHTTEVTQHDLTKTVDITSAQKYFDLTLKEFGPYNMDYTRNGRFLVIGGERGHIAAIEWQTKKLLCEINVMETINDVKWLHQETMFAVAQKQWTYMYDNQGTELHCLKALDSVLKLEFLPYHFLLASSNAKGYLSYLDVSVGQKVMGHSTGLGRLGVMCHNPKNAVVCLGHPGGTVTMWSPNLKTPLVKMLCHGGTVRSLAVDHRGTYMATSGVDRTLKIWDLRTFKMLQSYKIGTGAASLDFSQRELLALSKGNIVEVYRDCCRQAVSAPYMKHRLPDTARDLQFCPFEDVLGVGHGEGFSSLLIPGAGEANFDALEANPYQSKQQRRQAEVKLLLEKVPHEMISLDTTTIGHINTKSLKEKIEEKNKLHFIKPKKMEYEPKYKMKGRSKGQRKENRKQGVIETQKRKFVKEQIKLKQKKDRSGKVTEKRTRKSNVLDRFRTKPD